MCTFYSRKLFIHLLYCCILYHFSPSDLDECMENMRVCGVNSECINTAGSSYCQCLDGFTGQDAPYSCPGE